MIADDDYTQLVINVYLVAEEKHDGAGVVQFIHGVEIRDLCDTHQVDDGKVFNLFRHTCKYLFVVGV